MPIVNIDKLIIAMMPYFMFIVPVLPFINRLNFVYLFVSILYIIMRFRPKQFKGTVFFITSILMLIVYSFASLIWTINISQGISTLLALATGFIVMSTIVFCISDKNIDVFMKHMYICTLIILIIAIYEIYTGNYMFIQNIDFIGRRNMYNRYYPTVFFSNPNDVAYYLLIATPISISYLIKNNKKILPLIVSIFSLIIILNTESKLTLLSMIFVLFTVICLIYKSNTTVRRYLLFTIFMILLFTIILFILDNPNVGNIFMSNQLLKVDKSQSYFTIRQNLLQQAFELGIEYFPFGAGLGSITSLLNIPPHNLFALFWADLGIFIFILFISFYLYGIYKLYKVYSFNSRNLKKYTMISSIVLALWTIMPIITSISSVAEQRKITWILIGLSISQIKIYTNNKIKNI